MKSSLVEACINAFEHSKSITGKITIRFVTQKNKLLIIVRDYGKGFDPASIIRKRFSSIRNRGWGIIIMKRFMNSVTFDSNKEGSQVKMTKYL
jgi:serine/threonine-protein kinase RsbW